MLDNDTGAASDRTALEGTRRIPATERVLDHILAQMDAGRLAPGQRINAARLASTLGLSAAPVREALSVLAGRGVLDLHPDRGAVMRPFNPREVVQLWIVLAPIAGLGLRLAAQAIAQGASSERLRQAFDAICQRPRETPPVGFILRLNAWHQVANDLGGNPFVAAAIDRLGIVYWDRYLVDLIDVGSNIDGYLANYRRMHDAVMAGDGDSASTIMHYHIQWSIGRVEAVVAARPRPRARRLPS